MQYRQYGKLGFSVSALGLGCMRLPLTKNADGTAQVDRALAYELIRYAVDHGINYIDTALTYHRGQGEKIVGEALQDGYRAKIKLATKQPFGYMKTQGDIRRNLENTLQALGTDYLDCYLVHNVQPQSWEEIKRREVLSEYEKFRQEGLIRHIGFSYHGNYTTFRDILEYYPWEMCQIQQNLLDVDHEATEEAIHLAGRRNTALVIMEPLRGGGLVTPPASIQHLYDSYSTHRPAVEWAFRHLIDYPEISCVLSGMSSLAQLKENIAIFSKLDALPGCLTQQERTILKSAKKAYEAISSIPCTGCEYCMPCPQGVNIPSIFLRYNEGVMYENFTPSQRWYMLLNRVDQDARNCIACGACEKACPQQIPIIAALKKAHEALDGWTE